jgi:Flp pilus assembly CpaE family ATPase
LEEADVVIVVGTADPVGLTRLIRALHELRVAIPSARPRVVVNRVRSGSLGSSPANAVGEALGRYAGVQAAALLPFDQAACDSALTHGRSLVDIAKSSKLRKGMQQLAAGVIRDVLS